MQKIVSEFSQNKSAKQSESQKDKRRCPSCGLLSLRGMPGGRDAICTNCGYKDPCCYD